MVRRLDCRQPESRSSPVSTAAAAARRGQLVVLPTETSYAVACDAFSADGVARLREAKDRQPSSTLPVMVGSVRGLDALAAQLTKEEKALVAGYWPGPLTVVCKAQPSLHWDVTAAGHVTLRMPLHPVALELLDAVGPMVVMTANRRGEPPPVDCDAAIEQLGDTVSIYLDGGECLAGPPSTIVDLTGPTPVLLREGAITIAELRDLAPALLAEDSVEGAPA